MFVLLALLIPCLWVTYIWDQIIDPHYESDTIPIPDHRLLRCFYYASKKITGRFLLRTPIFIIIALLFVAFGVLDIVSIRQYMNIFKKYFLTSFFLYRLPSHVPKSLQKYDLYYVNIRVS